MLAHLILFKFASTFFKNFDLKLIDFKNEKKTLKFETIEFFDMNKI